MEISTCGYVGTEISTCRDKCGEASLVDTEVLKLPFLTQEVLKHTFVVLEILKQQIFNTGGAETSTCASRCIETFTLSIRGTKTYQIVFGHDRSLICLTTMTHFTGLHDVILR
jgi:hypothetical protein